MVIVWLILIVVIVRLIASYSRMRRMRGWGYTRGFWPLFWFGGHGLWNSWYRQHGAPRPPRGPGMGGPGMGGPGPRPGARPGGMGGPGARPGGMGMGGPGARPGSMGGPGARPGGMGARPGGMGGRPGGMGGHGGPGGGHR